nr:GDSL-type esterase/lipase family protein [Sphingomonas sp. R-74633]
MLALLLQAAPCTGPVCNFDTLGPWAARLNAARSGAAGVEPLHILQIGDSHTAGDALTGAWRDLVQDEGGRGGRGVLPPGRPYAGYLTRGVTVTMSPSWQVAASFGPGSAPPRPPLGLSGFTLTSTTPDARMALTADPAMAFDRFVLCALTNMVTRSVAVKTGDDVRTIDLNSDIVEPRCTTLRYDTPQTAIDVIADKGAVTLTSWATFRDHGGVVLSNLGIVGSQLQHFARIDDDVLAAELGAYAPDLIVLAFGTNEGFAPHFDPNTYRATLIEQVNRLRRLAPGVPLLMLGPPQALSRNPALRANAEGALIGCPAADPAKPPLFEPPALGRVRSIQREVAQEMHFAWWDWGARMGGPCAAVRWVADGRMRGDYVHLTSAGGRAVAQLLEDDLVRFATSDQ